MTIVEAVEEVMRRENRPLTVREAYTAVVRAGLFQFKSADPLHIVHSAIRRHTVGLDFPSSASRKNFVELEGGKYWLAASKQIPKLEQGSDKTAPNHGIPHGSSSGLDGTLTEIDVLRHHYLELLEERLKTEFASFSSTKFEMFGRRLIEAYGFEDATVTKASGDGGIDGFGKLKVGLAYLDVAFQCKRWSKTNVQRPDVDRFRGAIQGDFAQGILFTTSSFSAGAIGASIKKGAVPVVLMDGTAISKLMIEHGFGFETRVLTLPTYDLNKWLDGGAI